MTKFNSLDHNEALRACWDACDFGAKDVTSDVELLSYCAGMAAANESVHYTRAQFSAALSRVNSAIAAAMAADPERAARVRSERDAAARAANERRLAAGRERAAANDRRQAQFSGAAIAAGAELKRDDPKRYAEILTSVQPELDALPPQRRPKQVGAVGALLLRG